MAGNNSNTLMLLHCDGADTSTSFVNVAVGGDVNATATAIGDAQVDTGITDAFGGNAGALLLDGGGDYIQIGPSFDFHFEYNPLRSIFGSDLLQIDRKSVV